MERPITVDVQGGYLALQDERRVEQSREHASDPFGAKVVGMCRFSRRPQSEAFHRGRYPPSRVLAHSNAVDAPSGSTISTGSGSEGQEELRPPFEAATLDPGLVAMR